MNVISPLYRQQNQQLHELQSEFGTSSKKWARVVRYLADTYAPRNILDYGCGKQLLARQLPSLNIQGYDPAFTELSEAPEPADLVICTDVLEHIEPDYIQSVLDDLQRVVRGIGFFVISTRPATRTLPDGRNAHLIQMSGSEWLRLLTKKFDIAYYSDYLPSAKRRRWLIRRISRLTSALEFKLPKKGQCVVLVTPRAKTDSD